MHIYIYIFINTYQHPQSDVHLFLKSGDLQVPSNKGVLRINVLASLLNDDMVWMCYVWSKIYLHIRYDTHVPPTLPSTSGVLLTTPGATAAISSPWSRLSPGRANKTNSMHNIVLYGKVRKVKAGTKVILSRIKHSHLCHASVSRRNHLQHTYAEYLSKHWNPNLLGLHFIASALHLPMKSSSLYVDSDNGLNRKAWS